MQTLRLYLLIIFFLPPFAEAQQVSGSERMDFEIRSMITDLKMTNEVQTKFIGIYKQYGVVMIEAKKTGMSRWNIYLIYLKASRERDLKMRKILTDQQYNFFLERQKMIDKMGSSMY